MLVSRDPELQDPSRLHPVSLRSVRRSPVVFQRSQASFATCSCPRFDGDSYIILSPHDHDPFEATAATRQPDVLPQGQSRFAVPKIPQDPRAAHQGLLVLTQEFSLPFPASPKS
jgi:hypothetical protein